MDQILKKTLLLIVCSTIAAALQDQQAARDNIMMKMTYLLFRLQ